MRAAAKQNGVSVKAYAGTTGVLLGCDIDARSRDGLLGFAIERSGGQGGHRWLSNLLNFPGVAHEPGAPVTSDEAPIQKFRWSDYTIYPGTEYEYAIHPVYGEPGKLEVEDGPTVRVTSSSTDSGDHRVIFNRAAAASQAFSREFPGLGEKMDAVEGRHEEVRLPPKALAWLSRGALEQITGFVDQAKDPTWALDIAIYEFELPAIIASLEAARARGAQVRIVYHAKVGDPQTEENERNLRKWPQAIKRPRLTSAICHDKFIVLSRIEHEERVPQAVLCGSTNFTENGVYRQANVVHVAAVRDIAARYLSAFEALFGGASQGDMRKWINANDPLSSDGPLQVGFSPRTDEVDLDFFVGEINKAQRDLLFCTAFAIKDRILEALLGKPHDDVLRLGVQNTRSKITGYHRDRTADFSAAALLSKGLEGFLKESMAGQKGSIFIHTKLIVVDFTSPAPTVISGSHNFSHNASYGNDENYLVIRGNPDVADCYGVELMRIFDHYRFRYHVKSKGGAGKDPCPRPPGTLCPSDLWTTPYFEAGTLEMADRLRFGGRSA